MSSPSQMSTISDLEAQFGLEEGKDPQQYWHAMQQWGAANKRLSQVGDASASLTLWTQWFPTAQSRGAGDKKRQTHLSNANLARRGRALGIDQHMRCNAGTEFISDSMIATTMEALLGAAFYNGGLDFVAQMLKVMDLGSGLDAISGLGKSVAKFELWFGFEDELSRAWCLPMGARFHLQIRAKAILKSKPALPMTLRTTSQRESLGLSEWNFHRMRQRTKRSGARTSCYQKKDVNGVAEGATDPNLVRILAAAEAILRDAYKLCSDTSPDRKMTQQRANNPNEFYAVASGKADGFRRSHSGRDITASLF
ncbi:hypothetical protein V490_07723 [Pseudogymnoascus sp. VKM F-3557]|nr:hypothetical protein V490_07723 [Pseudogymnoascus sp. VKM F-3557]